MIVSKDSEGSYDNFMVKVVVHEQKQHNGVF